MLFDAAKALDHIRAQNLYPLWLELVLLLCMPRNHFQSFPFHTTLWFKKRKITALLSIYFCFCVTPIQIVCPPSFTVMLQQIAQENLIQFMDIFLYHKSNLNFTVIGLTIPLTLHFPRRETSRHFTWKKYSLSSYSVKIKTWMFK